MNIDDELRDLARWVNATNRKRAEETHGDATLEEMERVSTLGVTALEKIGFGTGVNGDISVLDTDSKLSKIVAQGAEHMGAFNDMTALMDGGKIQSDRARQNLESNRNAIGYAVGRRLCTEVQREEQSKE